jgi:hypothetical protein
MVGYLVVSLLVCSTVGIKSEARLSEAPAYTGICGASAGVAVGTDLFIVADDESSQLRVYSAEKGGPAVQVIDLTPQLELVRRAQETDIEGAARSGDFIYWITSHSRNNAGKAHPNRSRFFATTVKRAGSKVEVSLVGRPYKDLLQDLASSEALRELNLAAAARLPPKAPGGLNIEGLCATPDHRLLIGFRNPIPGGKALVVPLENPDEVITGRQARFGAPIRLDLNGLGIRDMVFWGGQYLIIAGSHDGSGKSRLYSWAGGDTRPKHLKAVNLKGLNPEAVIIYPDRGFDEVQLLSDDSGARQGGGIQCKDLPAAAREFRSVWIKPGVKPAKPPS